VCRGRPGTLLIWLCNQLGTIKFDFRAASLLENGRWAAHIRRMAARARNVRPAHQHLTRLADEVEQAMKSDKTK
jgi:hypothetical protein